VGIDAGIDIVGTDLDCAAAVALVLSGCAAGQDAQTANQQPAIDGVNADAGLVGIRDAAIAAPDANSYPAGSDAALEMTLVNNGYDKDALVSVSSTAANAAIIGLDGPPSSNKGVNVTPLESGSGSAGGSATVGPSAVLTGLTQPLFPSQTVPVTLRFRSGATINVQLAARLTSGGASAPTVNITPSGES
jgi:copper(I)-binding protein